MLEVIICDDNKVHSLQYTQQIEEIIKTHSLEMKIALVADEPRDVLRLCKNINQDSTRVYILDIDLSSQMNGLQLAKRIRENDPLCYLIFLTAHMEYVFLSFKVKTFDFLVKPVNHGTLERTLISVQEDFEKRHSVNNNSPVMSIQSGGHTYVIKESEIVCFEKMRDTLFIHTCDKTITCYRTLKDIRESLESCCFYQCHQSFIINLCYIQEFDHKTNEVVMKNGIRCGVSRRYRKELLSYVSSL